MTNNTTNNFNRKLGITKKPQFCQNCSAPIIFHKNHNDKWQPAEPFTYARHSCAKHLYKPKISPPQRMMVAKEA